MNNLKSLRVKLFSIMCIITLFIVTILIIVNNLVLEFYYTYSKTSKVKEVFEYLNEYTTSSIDIYLETYLKKTSMDNNIDIFIKSDSNELLFSTESSYKTTFDKLLTISSLISDNNNVLYQENNITIEEIYSSVLDQNYLLASGVLNNGNIVLINIPLVSIKESVQISNNVLMIIAFFIIIFSSIILSYLSKNFTKPIVELNNIANNMANLDFSNKYIATNNTDEINTLGISLNTMSKKLETTITQLRNNNIELEKDIERQSKIDEMRKQFISDVSHELKTPISLIQGYSEGLYENINTSEESKKYYLEVIMDETKKMDTLVKKLLDLMKLEYGELSFNNADFNISKLCSDIIKRNKVLIEQNNINIIYNFKDNIIINADLFYIEQIVTNYLGNAIKHCSKINLKKEIILTIKHNNNKLFLSVFNTGESIKDEHLDRIWVRFYKIDSSRNRELGGSGIGLSIVKAIIQKYNGKYGVKNKLNGVEFFIEI